MALLVYLVLILAMACGSGANWCICRNDVSDASLQKTLDYACGAGADCGPVSQNGVCYQPNTVRSHCSYAVNSYFQKKGQAQGSCDFAGTATVVSTDPSTSSTCIYPSSASTIGTTTPATPSTATPTVPLTPSTPSMTPPVTPTPTTTPPSTPTTTPITNPGTTPTTPTVGGFTTPTTSPLIGGTNSGISPTGLTSNTDLNGCYLPRADIGLSIALWILSLVHMIQ